MQEGISKKISRLSLEEKVLNGACLASVVFLFFPWVGGEWLGGQIVRYNGLGFFTSFIGVCIMLLHVFTILVTLVPLSGGPALLHKDSKHIVRFVANLLACVLCVAAWSVLTKFTFEFSRLQIHFGMYVTLIGSVVALLYSFLLHMDAKRKDVHDLFHQQPDVPESLEPEQHRIR